VAHDQFWKEVLTAFFREFLELFFPDVAAQIDFDAGYIDPKQEVFTDVPEGERRTIDLVFEVTTRAGDARWVLVHVEVERERRGDMPYRMWEYYHLLRLRRKLSVFPVVLYLAPGAGGLTQERYGEGAFGRETVDFRYDVVDLPDLSAEDYLEQENVLAPALSALMRSSATSRVMRKLRAYSRIVRSDVDEARRMLLAAVVERYLKLDVSEEEQFQREIGSEEVTEMKTLYDYAYAHGAEEGEARGEARATVRERKLMLRRLVASKLGDVPEGMAARIETLEDPDTLDRLIQGILDGRTLVDLGLMTN
jgi:hypothetical protein